MATPVIRVVAGTMPRRTMPASSMKLRARASRSSPAALNRAYPDRLHFKTSYLRSQTNYRGERKMMRAFKLYTGPDNASHVLEGTIDEKDRTDVIAIHFKETPAHSSYDWHPDPEPQFVITLSGTLEFATPDGETFVVRPGDVLVAEDHIGKGHKWRLIDDQPWRRAYVVLKPGAKGSFVPNTGT